MPALLLAALVAAAPVHASYPASVFGAGAHASGPPSSLATPSEVRRTGSPSQAPDTAPSDASVLADWVALPAPPAHEALATDRLLQRLPGWTRDRNGNLVLVRGEGSPTRVVACGIDRPSYVVSRITPDGYLRLHTVGRVPREPLWNGFREGQQVTIHTAGGPLPAVTAIANAHFSPQHSGETGLVTADELWVDAGARSAAEAKAMGIQLLDPVTRRLPPWSYGDLAAGPAAGARVGCASVAAVAGTGRAPATGRTVFLLTTQSVYGWVGLGAAVARLGSVDELTLLTGAEGSAVDRWRGLRAFGALAPVLRSVGIDSVRELAPAARYPRTIVESVSAGDASALRARVAEVAGMPRASDAPWPSPEAAGGGAVGSSAAATGPLTDPGATSWSVLAERAAAAPDSGDLAPLAELLGRLADLPAVSGHEERVRKAVLAALPEWARRVAEVDPAGNIVVAFGPDRDTTVFMAHQDEVGWRVEGIRDDGTVTLQQRGGFYARAWEGQPAILYPSDGSPPLRGVFVPRSGARGRNLRDLTARFGFDAAGLASRGVRTGDQVLGYKEALRLGPVRLTARSEDDRSGDSALLLALRRLDPARVRSKVVFAWTVEEEIGLNGARSLARRIGRSTTRVYSVDTFVTSDTPLETHGFAYAPLGDGPVLRSAENSSITTRAARERVERIAGAAGIPLQIGLTQGGTDGTEFTFWGAPNAGLSWPGRYSHSPVEVLDLRDVARLARLVQAVAEAAP